MAEPRANKLSMMAGVLNVSIMWLLNGEGDGLDAPHETQPMPEGMDGLLTEMRELKASMKTTTDRLGRLEKKLRSSLAQPVD